MLQDGGKTVIGASVRRTPLRAASGEIQLSTATAASAGVAPAAGTSYGSPSYRLYVLLVLTLVYTLNFIDRNLLNVIAQPIIDAFKLDDTEYGFLNGPPFAIFYALMGIPIAMAADRYNRVVIIALCISIWSVMAALCGFATSFLFLLVARIGVAIGEAGCTPPSNSIIGDYFKPKSRANALAIFAMGVTIGGALSNYFGGPIARNLNGAALEKLFAELGLGPGRSTDRLERRSKAGASPSCSSARRASWSRFCCCSPSRSRRAAIPIRPARRRSNAPACMETLRELGPKPTFWTMAIGAALTALVGYGLTGFQAPMVQRVHGVDPGDIRVGVRRAAGARGGASAPSSAASSSTAGRHASRRPSPSCR